jgi:hypothetical protein
VLYNGLLIIFNVTCFLHHLSLEPQPIEQYCSLQLQCHVLQCHVTIKDTVEPTGEIAALEHQHDAPLQWPNFVFYVP